MYQLSNRGNTCSANVSTMNPCSRTKLGKQPGQEPSLTISQPGHPEHGHCSAAGVPRCHPKGLEVPVVLWPRRALSILHREIETPPVLRGSYHPPAAGPREGRSMQQTRDGNRTGHCTNRRNCQIQVLDEVQYGLAASGHGRSLPEEGRGKLSGVVPRQTPSSALQAIQPLWTVPCSLKQAGSAGQAQSSHEWMRGSEEQGAD